MMLGEKWTIYWTEYSSDTYLYGSEITYHRKDDVEFRNLLMPPGTVLKSWFSKTNIQLQQIEPALPLIDGEGAYHISVNMKLPEGESCLVRLVFYDRFDLEVGSITLREKETDFRCPLSTYSYCLQLINGGATHFHFHSVVISEVIDETKRRIAKTK